MERVRHTHRGAIQRPSNARTEGINRLIRHVKPLGFRNSANDHRRIREYGSTAPGITGSNTGIKIIARSGLKSRYAGDADPANHDLEWLHSPVSYTHLRAHETVLDLV